MNTRRNITIAVVAILAIGLGLVVYGVLMQPHPQQAAQRTVLTAAMRIPAHSHITAEMLATVQRPPEQVQADAYGSPNDAIGQVALIDIPEGAVVTSSMVAKATPPPTGLVVANGMRAITIAVDPVKGINGLLKPGDHVDIIAIPPRGPGSPLAFTILRDITILAVGSEIANPVAINAAQGTAQPTPPPQTAGTVTLAVTPQQADLLASADLNAQLRLALRSPNERANSEPVESLVYPQAAIAKAAPAPTPPSLHPGVLVINGDVAQP